MVVEARLNTIAAVATAAGEAAIGVVRISGPRAWAVAASLNAPEDPQPRRACLCTLRRQGVVLDEALALFFRAPSSFTGEDVVELQCHGGAATMRAVFEAVIAEGAVPAEPGEFSRRAFMNGRLDLLQVEAIADVIHAGSEASRRLAQQHLAGGLSKAVDALKAPLAELMMLVEAAIDFSLEEHVYSISADEIVARGQPVADGIEALLGTWDAGRMKRDGVRVAIVGRPNAGKSSLLNHLLGQDRALVTEVAGTTRDYIEEVLQLDGVEYRLVDTAGLRSSDDRIEAMGVARAREVVRSSDAALVVIDGHAPGALQEICEAVEGLPVVLIINKSDLGAAVIATEGFAAVATHALSLSTGHGTEALPGLLRALAEAAGYAPGDESVLLTRARHRRVMQDALDAMRAALSAAAADLGHELVALDLRLSLDALGSMTGAVTSEDILHRIFADFCVGK